MAELLKGPGDGRSKEDYLEVTLLDETPPLDPMGQLRAVFPQTLQIRREERQGESSGDAKPNVRTTSDVDLFKGFYRHVAGEDLSEEQLASFVSIVDSMGMAEREVKLDSAESAKPQAAEVEA